MPKNIRTRIKNTALVAERREFIIMEAIELFSKNGYRETSTRELAETCGISPGSLYQYIGNKNDLLHLIILHQISREEINLKKLREILEGDVVTGLIEYIRFRIERADRYPFFIQHSNRNRTLFTLYDRDLQAEQQTSIMKTIEKVLNKGIESGVFKISSTVFVANVILTQCYDWINRSWFLHKHFTVEEYIRACTESIFGLIMVDKTNIRELIASCQGESNSTAEVIAIE